ncbi:hypothetical protein LIER_31064 [Lithospermum erythrorhizon]|uniref:Xylanase inhibitor C-terminal domain-containing protein n=1 Tax=Lithospermum erythrorhizon TaxID=34254 RepID=A0AAV3RRM0_LITER
MDHDLKRAITLLTPNIQERCSNCQNGFTSCNEPCLPYGSRIYSNNGGFSEEYELYITDTLNFPSERMDGFVIGCTNMSFVGIAGFGRGPLLIPESPDKFPRMKLRFREGEEMEVAMMGCFHYSDEQDLACMTFYTDDSESSQGPSIILGNYQQQNIFMEFDLANDRLGFREKIC